MSEMRIADRADEAAHQAVLEIIKANSVAAPGLAGRGTGERMAENLIEVHKKLAAYYRSLDEK